MPHDPARVADTKAWLSRAATDLRAAALDLAGEPPVLDDLVFHCQQAVEKAMKSLLTWHDEPFGKTHNLEPLGEACLRLDSSLRLLVDRAVPLTEYAPPVVVPPPPSIVDQSMEYCAWAAAESSVSTSADIAVLVCRPLGSDL